MSLMFKCNYSRYPLSRILIIILILIFGCSNFVSYADESTTTRNTAAKDSSPNPTIYMETTEQNSTNHVYFGAKNEPQDGVYVGVTLDGGTLSNGGYGAVNGDLLREGSLISLYIELEDPYAVERWLYLFRDYISRERGLLVNMNFNFENGDVDKINDGFYDDKFIEDFEYLQTLPCPCFVRLGGEMNLSEVNASDFRRAFRRIASLSATYGPKVALVFSPNYVNSVGIDMDSYYPGDDVCDWVGASLYYNKYATNGDRRYDSFYGVGLYGDAVLNVQQVVNLSRLHNKPIMITEGGSAWYLHNEDVTAYAADRVTKAMSFLTMVYPEIKAIVYSDTNFNTAHSKYSLTENPALKKVYLNAVNKNPSYARTISQGSDGSGTYYTPLASNAGTWSGQITLAGYTYYGHDLNATWYLDGEKEKTTAVCPFRFTLDTAALEEGDHTVKVVFNSGASKSSTFHVGKDTSGRKVFRDVMDPELYFYEPVYQAVGRGIVNGTSQRKFSPYDSVKRADFLCMLYRMAGSPEVSGNLPFQDVADTAYYANAVRWAVQSGVTSGRTANTFDPEGRVTRAEAVTFLWRTAGSQQTSEDLSFSDVADNAFYANAVKWAVKNHIVNGVSETRFAPDNLCIRCDSVCLLSRM